MYYLITLELKEIQNWCLWASISRIMFLGINSSVESVYLLFLASGSFLFIHGSSIFQAIDIWFSVHHTVIFLILLLLSASIIFKGILQFHWTHHKILIPLQPLFPTVIYRYMESIWG